MFQDYEPPSKEANNPARITALRALLEERGLDGFLIPRSDEHQGEYVPPHAERLSWLTGFTGSAGVSIVLREKAAIFVDGRYTLQVRDQVACDVLTPFNSSDTSSQDWLEKTLKQGAHLAYDPWLHTIQEVKKLETACDKASATLVPTENLIDLLWDDQPPPPSAPLSLHPLAFSGQPTAEKIRHMQDAVKDMGAAAFLLTQPDSVCWLFNMRGRDVPHTPLVLCFALIHHDKKPELFIASEKVPPESRKSLETHLTLRPREDLLPALSQINGALGLDPATTSALFKSHVEETGGTIIEKTDPCVLPKACKNSAELDGSRKAHLRDGIAMVRFLAWLSRQPLEDLNEIKAAKNLERCRSETAEEEGMPLQDISFDTISGVGPNGAIVHYRVTEATNRAFTSDTLYLVDSGGQYQDGTTDITRTIAIGTPSEAMKRHFTLVLKGMIAISKARFPKGTNGAQLDTLARHALWQEGFDFDHGTGHGVGSFLSVHEGPQRIAKISKVPLEPGMILSNEPGYYKTDHYGIRIENLIVVTEPSSINGGDREMMGFETLTFAPIDRSLIDDTLLSAEERAWLDDYHAEVFSRLQDRLSSEDRAWLETATKPIG